VISAHVQSPSRKAAKIKGFRRFLIKATALIDGLYKNWLNKCRKISAMSDLFVTKLRILFEINAARQAEMDDLFLSMPNYPSKAELTLLHDTVEHSVPEAKALLETIDALLATPERHIPPRLFDKVMLQRSVLPDQIRNDRKLTEYLEKSYIFLTPMS
jgi:hypothetical protein